MARGDRETGSKLYGHGFEPSVCDTCPLQETKQAMGVAVNTCGICGCPTRGGLPMDRLNAPPEGCPKLDEHAIQSGNPENARSRAGEFTEYDDDPNWG